MKKEIKRRSRSLKVSNWDILELKSQMKLASKMRQYISTFPVISSFMKFCVARTFFVEHHLDVILEVTCFTYDGRYLTLQQLKKKTSSRSLSYKKVHKRQNDRKGPYTLAHFWEKLVFTIGRLTEKIRMIAL